MEYNVTSKDLFRPYTINLPVGMIKQLKEKANEKGICRVSIYIRAVLQRELEGNSTLTMSDIAASRKSAEKYERADSRREYMTSLEEKPKNQFIKLKIKKIFDLFQPKQYTLFK